MWAPCGCTWLPAHTSRRHKEVTSRVYFNIVYGSVAKCAYVRFQRDLKIDLGFHRMFEPAVYIYTSLLEEKNSLFAWQQSPRKERESFISSSLYFGFIQQLSRVMKAKCSQNMSFTISKSWKPQFLWFSLTSRGWCEKLIIIIIIIMVVLTNLNKYWLIYATAVS